MALTVTRTSTEQHNLGSKHAVEEHVDVTEYASGGWVPNVLPGNGTDTAIGLITLWQENADYVLRWDATNGKVLAYVMSTGAEAGAVDIGELKYMLISSV